MAMVKTTPENLKRINDMQDALANFVWQLYDRWLDEREHEDIAEYGKVIQAKLPQGFNLRKMNKRPFGFDFDIGTEAVYQVFCTTKTVGWKRTK